MEGNTTLIADPAYTEDEVRDFFDRTLHNYLSFWDSEGVLHTGWFADDADEDYRGAATRTSDNLAAEAGIDSASYVLDAGCGCGNFLIHLAERFGCGGVGLDLSAERVKFAQQGRTGRDGLRIEFQHGSVTQMPYEPETFSHVISQDALFLVPDKARSHAEIHRVLRPGGIFACTDFLQPTAQIGARAREHVYDRVRWSGGYSLLEYQTALAAAGFEIVLARSLERQIKQTYRVLGKIARERAGTVDDRAAKDWMLAFAVSCDEIQIAIDGGEFGWGMFVARKPSVKP